MRWWAHGAPSQVTLPLVMVDSGQSVSNGYLNFQAEYSAMVNTSLARSPKGQLSAYYNRVNNVVYYQVQVTNQSGTVLNYNTNGASVSAILYEDARVQLTNRFARGVSEGSITNLANGASAVYNLQVTAPAGVNWNKMHYLTLADYRPGGASGAYDQLQAAIAAPTGVDPAGLFFLIKKSGTAASQSVTIAGLPSMSWTAAASAPWINLSAASGNASAPPQISVNPALLADGYQSGTVSFQAPGNLLADSVSVSAYVYTNQFFLPLTFKK